VQGGLTVSPGVSGQMEYGGTVSTKGQDRSTCGEVIIVATIQVILACSDGPWVLSGPDVTGSCDSDHPQFWHDEFNWHLTAGSCGASAAVTLAGTCGGAVATR
jgi:hypothetical protein